MGTCSIPPDRGIGKSTGVKRCLQIDKYFIHGRNMLPMVIKQILQTLDLPV